MPASPPAPAYQPRPVRPHPVVYAQEEPRTNDEESNQSFAIDFGLATPLSRINFNSAGGGSDNNGNTGLLIGGQYLYHHTPRFGTGFDLEYFNRSATDSTSLFPDAITNVSGNTMLMMGLMKYSLVDRGPTRPYFLGGLGLDRTSTIIDVTPRLGGTWIDTGTDETRTFVDDSNWGLAYTARLGIDFHMFYPSFFSLEMGWTGMSNRSLPATTAGQDQGLNDVTGNLSAFTFAGRWSWRF